MPDGGLFAYLAEHQAVGVFALLFSFACVTALVWHTMSCKNSRRDFHAAIDDNTAAVHESGKETAKAISDLAQRVSALEAVSNAQHMQDMAALIATVKNK